MPSRYKLADVENLKKELELLPEIEAESRQVSLKDAMKTLAPVLRQMRQRRGYTNDQLLQVLRSKGITIAKSSLKDYLKAGRKPRVSEPSADTRASRGPAASRGEANTAPNGTAVRNEPAPASAGPPAAPAGAPEASLPPPPSTRAAAPAPAPRTAA